MAMRSKALPVDGDHCTVVLPHAGAHLRVRLATRAGSRAVGLLGTRDLPADAGLMLLPCAAVHAIGMRYRIGVAFLDAAGVVLRVVDPLPWWGARCPGARAVLETRSGVLAHVAPGDTMRASPGSIFPLGGNSVG